MSISAGIFDLDGVVTDTAKIHFKAWKQVFDHYLTQQAIAGPLFSEQDYLLYVDGKPRLSGIKSFFNSRKIFLPEGKKEDGENMQTVNGIAKKKQKLFTDRLQAEGIPLFDSTVAFIKQLRAKGIKTAIVSSSKNCKMILERTGIEALFQARVDGAVLKELGLAGKPNPDMFVEAARRIEVDPANAFIVEDAIAGVKAGQAGEFGLVIGIDRKGSLAETFYKEGADLVIKDMGDLTLDDIMNEDKLKSV